MEGGYAVGSIIGLMRGWKLLIKLESPDASSGCEATGVYQAQLIIESESGTNCSAVCKWLAGEVYACRRSPSPTENSARRSQPDINLLCGGLTVWVQSHGRLGWREYSARDHRVVSRSTAAVTVAASVRQDGCERLSIAHLLLSIWLMTKSWSFALRECPESCSMTDWPTPLTIHPFGRRYSRLYSHPLHLRLLLEEKKKKAHELRHRDGRLMTAVEAGRLRLWTRTDGCNKEAHFYAVPGAQLFVRFFKDCFPLAEHKLRR